MAFDTTQQSRFLQKLLAWVGLWHRSPGCHIPPFAASLLIHVPLTFIYTILMWLDVINSSDLGDAMDVLYIALTETALCVKVVNMLVHVHSVKSLFREWQTNPHFQLQSEQEHYMWRPPFVEFRRVVLLYISVSVGVVGSAFTAALFLDSYQLPFRYWTPFDWQKPQFYWYAYLYEMLAMPLTCLANCALDMFQCYILQHLAMCFGLVAMRLQNLGAPDSEGNNEDTTKTLIKIIQFDQQVRRMSRQCEQIVSYPILAQILLSALVLCFSLYRLQNVAFLDDPGNFISLVLYASCMILQIFLPCYYANKLTMQSAHLLGSVYNCNWIEMSAANRKLLLLYMPYLNKPVVLRAGNFFAIGLPVFSKTMNNAYSFFALLINMDID